MATTNGWGVCSTGPPGWGEVAGIGRSISGRSLASNAATTAGAERARARSSERSRAWAWGERRKAAWSSPVGCRSST